MTLLYIFWCLYKRSHVRGGISIAMFVPGGGRSPSCWLSDHLAAALMSARAARRAGNSRGRSTVGRLGPFIKDVRKISGILDPLLLFCILTRSKLLNPCNLPYFVCLLLGQPPSSLVRTSFMNGPFGGIPSPTGYFDYYVGHITDCYCTMSVVLGRPRS